MSECKAMLPDTPGKHPSGIRTDIQALRAIAVVLVILDHLMVIQRLPGHPLGGFIGVDIFFVISGFLITQHLAKEAISTGNVSFANFYRRRVRRIVPMALLVITATLAASLLVFWPWQTASSALDGLWSALFVSNIAFAIRGVDYFSADHVSVFQHYWSLSVEEQFYLVWPVLVALIATMSRRDSKARTRLLWTAIVLGLASFVWACIETRSSPASAYFSTLSRTFQFAAGAALALLAPRLERVPSALRRYLSASGMMVIATSLWLIDPAVGFPGPMGLLPTLGAVLFIAAGTGTRQQVACWPLNTRPVTYVGDISYSLYLWHWPIIVFLTALVPRDIAVIPGTLVLTLGLSALSYRHVEQAVLASSWLANGKGLTRQVAKPINNTSRSFVRSSGIMSAGILLTGAIIATGDFAVRGMAASRASADEGGSLSVQAQPDEARARVEEIQKLVAVAEKRSDWAGLQPAISDISVYGTELTKECWTGQRDTPRSCVRGNPDAPRTIVVLGDSIAMNAAFSVDAFVQQNPEWKLVVYAKLGCAFAEVSQNAPDGSAYPECETFRRWAVQQILKDSPDAVWATSAVPTRIPGVSGASLYAAWQQGVEATLKQLQPVSRVFVVAPPPAGQDLAFCSRPFNQPSDCASTVSGRWIGIGNASQQATAAYGRTYVDTGLWYCDKGGHCPAVIGNMIVRRDERHLTYAYGNSLGPLVGAWVVQSTASQAGHRALSRHE